MKFLQKMGFSVSRLETSEEEKKKKEKKDNRVDRSDLLALARTFNVRPNGGTTQKKQETLDEFLAREEGAKSDV